MSRCFTAKETFEQKRERLRLLRTSSNVVVAVVAVDNFKAP